MKLKHLSAVALRSLSFSYRGYHIELDLIDGAGHIGYFCLFLGQLMIARRKLGGWTLRLMGEAVWVALGVYLGLTSIWMWGTLFLIVDAMGAYNEQAAVKKSQG